MWKRGVVAFVLLASIACTRTPKNVVDDVGRTIGAAHLKSIQYSGSGYIFVLGQNYTPNDPWPNSTSKATPAWWTTRKALRERRMFGHNLKIRRAAEDSNP